MELLFKTYQVSYFTNNSDVTATPSMLGTLLTNLASFSLLPMFGQEFNALSGEKRQMVIMTSPDQAFRVEFPHGAIIFHGLGGSSEEFIDKVSNILNCLKGVFPNKKSTRLAVVNAYFYQDSKENYSELYKRIFTHHNADPFEWDNRIVEHVTLEASNEVINSGSGVRRCYVQTPMVDNNNPTEVITFELDSNTLAEETSLRFDFKSAGAVIKELQSKNDKLIRELARYTSK